MTIDQLNKLTDEEVRVRVAARLGWRFADKPFRGARQWLSPDGKWLLKPWDYPADLNAMHEAEKTLSDKQWDRYIDYLGNGLPALRMVCSATAKERALAFLAVTEREEG